MSNLINQAGWIYICMDLRHLNECKIGMTKRSLYKRLSETGNPNYMLVKAYKVPLIEALKIEQYLHRQISYKRQCHFINGYNSEWFCCSPAEAAKVIEPELAKCLGVYYDEDGNYDLSPITFKPSLDKSDGLGLFLSERINSLEEYNNLVNAIADC